MIPYTFESLASDQNLYPSESLYSEKKEFVITVFCDNEESRVYNNNEKNGVPGYNEKTGGCEKNKECAVTADTEIAEQQVLELTACYLGTAFTEDVCISSEQVQRDSDTGCIRYTVTACRKVWSDEERRQQIPEQIISRALRIYVPDESVQNRIRNLTDAPEEQLALLNLYREDPDRIRKEYSRIVQQYSGTCPSCGARQIQNGLRREYRFWKSIRQDPMQNRCRFCGQRWKTE